MATWTYVLRLPMKAHVDRHAKGCTHHRLVLATPIWESCPTEREEVLVAIATTASEIARSLPAGLSTVDHFAAIRLSYQIMNELNISV